MTLRSEFIVLLAGLVVGLSALFLVPGERDYAELRFLDGRVIEALNDSLRLRQQSPDDVENGFQLSRTQLLLGDTDGAARALESLIASGADAPVLRLTLADIYSSLGRKSESLDHLLKVPLDYLNTEARANLVGWLRYSGRHAEEHAFLERLEAAELTSVAHRQRLALLRLTAGDRDRGLEGLRQLDDVEMLSGNPVRFTLLALLLDKGRKEEAGNRANNWLSTADNPTFEDNVRRAFRIRGLSLDGD